MQEYSADCGYPRPLRTAHLSLCPSTLSHPASNTPAPALHSVHLLIYLLTLSLPSAASCVPSPVHSPALTLLKAVGEGSPQLPHWPAWGYPSGHSLHEFLLFSLLCSTIFSISLICFFIIPLWHTIGIQRENYLRKQQFIVLIAPSQ